MLNFTMEVLVIGGIMTVGTGLGSERVGWGVG